MAACWGYSCGRTPSVRTNGAEPQRFPESPARPEAPVRDAGAMEPRKVVSSPRVRSSCEGRVTVMSQQRLTADPNGDEERSGEPIASPVGSEKLSAFLGSLQLGDSFFPSGLYTLSHGLEAFAQSERVGRENLEALLADQLRYGFGAADGVALACAHRAIEEGDLELAVRADVRLTAAKLPREARETSLRAGRQLLRIAGEIFGGEALETYAGYVRANRAPGNHAIVLGLVMATQGIARECAVAGELYA